MATTKTKAKPAPVEDDDLELEELEDEATEAPAKGKKVEDTIWGVRDLIALIKEKFDTDYTPREVRTLLRKMARDGHRIDREIIAGNKSRYSWEGPTDPEVKAILKAVKGGEIEEGKKAALDKLKADKAAKTAAAGDKPKAKKAKPPVDEDELEELDDDE